MQPNAGLNSLRPAEVFPVDFFAAYTVSPYQTPYSTTFHHSANAPVGTTQNISVHFGLDFPMALTTSTRSEPGFRAGQSPETGQAQYCAVDSGREWRVFRSLKR